MPPKSVETGFFAPQTRVRLEAKPRRVKLDKSDMMIPITPDQRKRVTLLIQETVKKHPRELSGKDTASKIVHGNLTGYSPKPRKVYLPGDPAAVMLDMLWLINNTPHMLWTSVMLAGVETIKELLEKAENNEKGY